ncbi:MAG: hypothetical protein R3C01_08440 [Planctomycetaceae bacterium]
MTQFCSGLMLTIALSGCGGGAGSDAPTTYKVTGTVQFDGKDLADGVIVVDPVDGVGSPAQGTIKDGKFEFQATKGEKTIRFSSNKATGEKGQYGEEITLDIIPEKYNGMSTLTETVKEDDTNSWSFTLEK